MSATTIRSPMSVCQELKNLGKRIPEDISVTGYDNSLYARGDLSLTTIDHPQEKLGEMAAELLLEKIRHVPESQSQVERLIAPPADYGKFMPAPLKRTPDGK